MKDDLEQFINGVGARLVKVTDFSRDQEREAMINPRYVVGAEQISATPESKWNVYVGRSLEYVLSAEDVESLKRASAL